MQFAQHFELSFNIARMLLQGGLQLSAELRPVGTLAQHALIE
jgi:hypothetical protein